MKVEVAVLGSPSLTVLVVFVDVKQQSTTCSRAQELCKSRGGRPELPVPNSPCGLCGRKATLNKLRSCVKVEVAVLGSPSPAFFMVSVDVKQR